MSVRYRRTKPKDIIRRRFQIQNALQAEPCNDPPDDAIRRRSRSQYADEIADDFDLIGIVI